MMLLDAATLAALHRTGAVHEDGKYRMRWGTVGILYEVRDEAGNWVIVHPVGARRDWPKEGWYVGRPACCPPLQDCARCGDIECDDNVAGKA